jgi:hypothetical protein
MKFQVTCYLEAPYKKVVLVLQTTNFQVICLPIVLESVPNCGEKNLLPKNSTVFISVVLIFKNVALHICRTLFNEIPNYIWVISSVYNFWVEI